MTEAWVVFLYIRQTQRILLPIETKSQMNEKFNADNCQKAKTGRLHLASLR